MVIKKTIYIAFAFLLWTSFAGAQTKTISWTSPTLVLDTLFAPKEVLNFDGAFHTKELFPAYTLTLYNSVVRSFTFTSTSYSPVSEKEQNLLSSKTIPSETSISVGVQNKKPVSEISFIPLRKNPQTGLYEKLTSFSYQVETGEFIVPPKANYQQKKQSTSFAKTSAAGSSVLSSGSWYKLAISSTGMFKIDHAFLKNIGINPDALDPRTIRIFGNGGQVLPQANTTARPDDLLENAIWISGENDGQFNQNDFVLFYGIGPHTWQYSTLENIFTHTQNVYSDESFYFLTFGGVTGARVQNLNSLGGAAQTLTTFDDYQSKETDLINVINSGREWFGESFDQNTFANFSFTTTGILNGSTIRVTSAVMGRSTVSTSFSVSINGSGAVGSPQSLSPSNLGAYDARGSVNRTLLSSTVSGSPASTTIGYQYNKGSSFSSVGHLNYIELNFRRALSLYNNQTSFRAIASTSAPSTTFEITNAAGAQLWQVTNIETIKNCVYSLSGSTASFSASSTNLEEYIIFSGSNFPTPRNVGQINNQNLHGINAPNLPSMVIVSHPDFVAQAQRLANFRRNNDNISSVVVTTEQIYNEFASGSQDVTAIRDFLKMLYDRNLGVDSLRYLLLFGDCSYDFKNRIPGNTNFVPTYQSRESLSPLFSYSSDDYFGFLDNTEGNWLESPAQNDRLDIGIGRIPAKNTQEAASVVDKLIHYSSSPNCLGKWRNTITFSADDGDGNLHLKDAEEISTKVDTTYKLFNINKIYLDAYPQEASPGGEKAPLVSAKIDSDIEKGGLIFNYSGHGGATLLAQENILTLSQIDSWNNFNRLPFMITATCDFGRCDDPGVVSGIEYGLLRPQGGIIGGITSARIVFAFSNKALNLQIYTYIFQNLPNGEPSRLGDAMRQTKNASMVGVNNRNYYLAGDPSLRLSLPTENSMVTQIKGVAVSAVADTLKALSKVTITGELRNSSNVKLTGFNGLLNLTVFDKKSTLTTLGTENSSPINFRLRNNFLFDGSATVTNGDWSVTFVVPKDISYQFDFGKISTYAVQNGSLRDGAGFYSNVIIGGTDPNAPQDNTPPTARLFMNDESFVFGGLTGKNALFIAKLNDENGINTAGSGVGHEIAAFLDNSDKPIILNEFYTANVNDYQNGTVRFPFKDLEPGPHSIRFKAWDTYNNSAENYLEFIVANDEKIALSHILNYPNPFSTHTVFHFDHNRSGEELDVMIQIYTITGKMIKSMDIKLLSSNAHFSDLEWNGRDDFGDRLARGVYVYRVWVRAPRDGSSVHKYEKLVILN